MLTRCSVAGTADMQTGKPKKSQKNEALTGARTQDLPILLYTQKNW